MSEPSGHFTFPHRVETAEIDELGHAGNYHYLRWMQHAAVAHSSANGWPASRYQELGCGWVVRSHQITYLKPCFEGDLLLIDTWVANMRRAASVRCYEIRNEQGERIAEAQTNWAFIDFSRHTLVRIPDAVSSSFVVVQH